MRALLLLASALLASGGSLCAASPKVAIRIVPRYTPEEIPAPVGPVPFRAPNVYWQGPFASRVESYFDPLPCVKETAVTIDSTVALLDVCHLKNVTLVKQPTAAEDDSSSSSEGEAAQPEMRKILGIFRGWKMDPITLRYKQMIFDDGDECGESGMNNRMGVVIDIVPAKSANAKPRVSNFKQIDACSFRATLFAHVSPDDMTPSDSTHTPGVLGITDANETLPHICAQRTCRFNTIVNKVRSVMVQVQHAENVTKTIVAAKKTSALATFTLNSSRTILRSTNAVLDRSLELLSTLEALQRELLTKLEEANQRVEATAESATQTVDTSESAAVVNDVANESIADEGSADTDVVQDDSSDDSSNTDPAATDDSVQEVVVEAEG